MSDLDLGRHVFDMLVGLNRMNAAILGARDAERREPVVGPAEPEAARPLDPAVLYLGDNGRAFCGTLACAGMTAYWSGHDRSGQDVMPLTARDAHEYGVRCEGCGMQPNLIVLGRV